MANTRLTFFGTYRSKTTDYELETFINAYNEIYITIEDGDGCQHICLDKSTAIKFAKTLRTEINKIKEVNNG